MARSIKQRKGAIWVSAVIYVMIAVVVLAIVLEGGLPLIKGLNEKNAFTKVQNLLVSLDKQIQQIASEGQGSQRVIPLEITDGELKIEDQKLRWKLETESKLIEPNTRVEQGNLVIATGVDVTATTEGNFFIIENSRIKANFSKIGTSDNYSAINTSGIINSIYYKDSSATTNGTFTFFINDSSSITGNGYTKLEQTGSGLTSASLKAHINNSNMEYNLLLTLDSKADFLQVAVRNFQKK
ncbi:hypothetical protein HYU12_00345 [Candidatus Woesearchaeota archaeon]|nr:hypothetical protein [Candidatus Woesearchaeota archaeon]